MIKIPRFPAGAWQTEKENSVLEVAYVALLTFMLAAYLLMVVLPVEGYNPALYRDAYVYFMVFDLVLFSLFVPFWTKTGLAPGKAGPLKIVAGLTVLAASSVPLVLTIFMAGRLGPVNLIFPLVLKAVWGIAVAGLVNCLEVAKPGWRWNGFLTTLFIFFVLVLGSLLTFFCTVYRQAVITTLYDRDIPGPFFLNPLLTLAGLVHHQAGGGTQLGLVPFYGCLLFWGLAAAVLHVAAVKLPGGGGASE